MAKRLIDFEVEVQGADELARGFRGLISRLNNLRPFYKSISSDFFRSNEALVFRNSPGRFTDLKQETKDRKLARFNRVYPILVATGKLRRSLSDKSDTNSVNRISSTSLEIGTKIPYARFHQEGKGVPERTILSVDIGRRAFRWTRILNDTIEKEMRKDFK